MFVKDYRGDEVDVYVESIKERGAYNSILVSEFRETTTEEVEKFFFEPCDHANCLEQLRVEVEGWLYNVCYCPVCGQGLGTV